MCQKQVHKQPCRADLRFPSHLYSSKQKLHKNLQSRPKRSYITSSALRHTPSQLPQPQPSCHPQARTSASTSSRSSSRLSVSRSSADVALISSSTLVSRYLPGFLVSYTHGKIALNTWACQPETDDHLQVDHQQVREARRARRLGECKAE